MIVDEAAKVLGSCTVRRHVTDGAIRTIRVGRLVLVPMDVMETGMVEGDGERAEALNRLVAANTP